MVPPYDARLWEAQLPRLASNLEAAARQAKARLVVLDNLYAVGRPHGRLVDEDVPMNPCSRKGEIRARVAEALFAAHERGDVRVTMGRASDFYGPGGVRTHFGEPFWRAALAGKTATLLVRLDTPHTYHFMRDVARGLATLGLAEDDVLGRAWMLPCAPALSTRELVSRFSEALERPIRVRSVPALAARALGLAVPVIREVAEMSYLWEEPFVVDDRRFRARFGLDGTPIPEGARETVSWARKAYSPGGPA
jgi:nucleoside-diphosphate-sugar epimerase